jgi:hypothetical protein
MAAKHFHDFEAKIVIVEEVRSSNAATGNGESASRRGMNWKYVLKLRIDLLPIT